MTQSDRTMLEAFFKQALHSVAGDKAVLTALQQQQFDKRVHVLAIGKAADSMMNGALIGLNTKISRALVVTKYGHAGAQLQQDPRIVVHESAHPVPDRASLDAGRLVIDFLKSVPDDDELLVLLSGGASALLEVLPDGMSLDDLSRLTDYLLASGMDITQMNQVRRSVSCIKGGRLAAHLSNCRVRQYLISDVPGNSLQDIGSGPLAVATDSNELIKSLALPDWIEDFRRRVPAAPDAGDARLAAVDSKVIASAEIAKQAACDSAMAFGFTVRECKGDLHQEVTSNADMIAATLRDKNSQAGVYVWAGESTLVLPQNPGRGGRNQHLAALLVSRIAGDAVTVLCGATDGTDGPTEDAGAIVDGTTQAAGIALGLDIEQYLQAADSGNWLEQLGVLLTTGPTGTNVMDLVIAVKHDH